MDDKRLDLQPERVDDTLVVKVSGRIDGVNASDFNNSLRDMIDEADQRVVLNLEDLLYISSAGLRSFLLTAQTLKRRDAKFALCTLPESVLEIIKIAGFDKIIDIFDSQSEALA